MTSIIPPEIWAEWFFRTEPSEMLDDMQDGRNWLIDVFKNHGIEPPKGEVIAEIVRLPGEDVNDAMLNCRMIFYHANPDPSVITKTGEVLEKLGKAFLEEGIDISVDEYGLQANVNPYTDSQLIEKVSYRLRTAMGERLFEPSNS